MKDSLPEGISKGMTRLINGEAKDDSHTAVVLTCLGFCEYFKGNEGEDGCGGLAAVKKGIASGMIGAAQVTILAGMKPGPAKRSIILMEKLCSKCSYREDGCDFMAGSPVSGATPCGGYRLLLAMMDHEALTSGQVSALLKDVECGTQVAK